MPIFELRIHLARRQFIFPMTNTPYIALDDGGQLAPMAALDFVDRLT
jgi:hypothetical protein